MDFIKIGTVNESSDPDQILSERDSSKVKTESSWLEITE